MSRKRGFMDRNLVFNILNQLKKMNYQGNLLFHLMGEPTLHPDFFEILEENAKITGNLPEITTNGAGLKEKDLERLVLAPTRLISLSFMTCDAESYSKYRTKRNLNYDIYLDRIKKILFFKTKHPQNRSRIEINVLTTRYFRPNGVRLVENRKEVYTVLEQWQIIMNQVCKDAGIKYLAPVHDVKPYDILSNTAYQLYDGIYLRLRRAHEFSGGAPSFPKKAVKMGGCSLPFYQMAVLWNGEATICCADYNGALVIGNVFEKTIIELWQSRKAELVREAFLKNKIINRNCQNCLGKPMKTIDKLKKLHRKSIEYYDHILRKVNNLKKK